MSKFQFNPGAVEFEIPKPKLNAQAAEFEMKKKLNADASEFEMKLTLSTKAPEFQFNQSPTRINTVQMNNQISNNSTTKSSKASTKTQKNRSYNQSAEHSTGASNNMFNLLASPDADSLPTQSPVSNRKPTSKDIKNAFKKSNYDISDQQIQRVRDNNKPDYASKRLYNQSTNKQSRNQPKHGSTAHFESHLDPSILESNLSLNQSIRQSIDASVPKSRFYSGIIRVVGDKAYVTCQPFSQLSNQSSGQSPLARDVLIATRVDRNRAFDGDLVAIKLTGVKQSSEQSSELIGNLIDDSVDELIDELAVDSTTQYTGIVVGILQSNHQSEVVGIIRPPNNRSTSQSMSQRYTLFQPFDRRYPFGRCLFEDWPVEIREHEKTVHRREFARESPSASSDSQSVPVSAFQTKDCLNDQVRNSRCGADSSSPEMVDVNSSYIYVMRYDEWLETDQLPRCRVVNRLGVAGTLSGEVEAAILGWPSAEQSEKIDEECKPFHDFKISDSDRADRRDLTKLRVFTIDPATARDLDDAISIETIDKNRYRIGVHIADVSHFVKPGTAIDQSALQRTTSLYLPDRVIPMLPRALSEHVCSLNLGVERFAFSVFFDLNAQGELIDDQGWMGHTIIKTVARFDYSTVQQIIDQQGLLKEEQRAQIEGKCLAERSRPMFNNVVSDLLQLHSLARQRRQTRFDEGSLKLASLRLVIQLDSTNALPIGVTTEVSDAAHNLIEELMLFTNIIVARTLVRYVRSRALLRQQSPPKAEYLERVGNLFAEQGFSVSLESSASIHSSMIQLDVEDRLLGEQPICVPARMVLEPMLTRPMVTAAFVCTSAIGKTDPLAILDGEDELMIHNSWHHFSLNFPHYTQFTSPSVTTRSTIR